MKLPNWVKIVLWLALIAFFSWLLSQRYSSIMEGTSNTTDIVIFLIWVALIAVFVFQEVDFFGVKLKKEIDNLRTDFKEQIINLRSDVQNSVNIRTEISPQIYLTPPTDSELPSIEERIRPVLEQVLSEQGIERPVPISEEPEVPDNTKYLFYVRYAIERELRRILERQLTMDFEMRPYTHKPLWGEPSSQAALAVRRLTAIEMARMLANLGRINSQLVSVIRDVIAVCSAAIHGKDVSEASINFVRDASSPLIPYLKSIV